MCRTSCAQPLTNIRSYAETLAEDDAIDPETSKSFLQVILNEVDRMTRIVKDLLTLSRLDYGKMDWKPALFYPAHSLEEVCRAIRLEAQRRRHELLLEIPRDLPSMMGDRERIEQVFINILSNAIKYTPEGGRIIVSADAQNGLLRVTVADNGIGIPEKDIPRLFERFYRVDKARARESGGTGLGLAIAAEIVHHHGGSIGIKSAPGKGTSVSITPAAQAAGNRRQHPGPLRHAAGLIGLRFKSRSRSPVNICGLNSAKNGGRENPRHETPCLPAAKQIAFPAFSPPEEFMKIKEVFKDIVLVCLVLSAGFLTWRNWIYDDRLLESPALAWLGLSDAVSRPQSATVECAQAAFPVCAAATLNGQRYGVQFEEAAVQEVCGRILGALGEALGSASAPQPAGEAAWRAALSQNGYYIAFDAKIPLSTLAAWYGTKLSASVPDADAYRLILCRNGDTMDLYFCDAQNAFFRCLTAVRYATLEGDLLSYAPNGCAFAFESDAPYDLIGAYSMLTNTDPAPADLLITRALDSEEKISAMLSGLGLNPLNNRHYEETDETQVFIEGACALRIYPDGSVVYRSSGAQPGENSLIVKAAGILPVKSEMIEAVRQIISKTADPFAGDAKLSFSGFEPDGDSGGYLISFCYEAGGIPIYFKDNGYAVQAAVKNGIITRMSFKLRTYRFVSRADAILPQKQAAAALSALSKNITELSLGYIDDKKERISAEWMGK